LILGNTGHLRVSINSDYTKVEYVKAYRPSQENGTRHNGDVVATYFVKSSQNCYDSMFTNSPIVWNSNYYNDVIYPNPSSDDTNIQFTLNGNNNITLQIFDLNGQLVRTLLNNELLVTGQYTMHWDLQDYNRLEVAAGTYIYSISNQNKQLSTGKISILK
jgi:hypothetical protein